MRSSNRARHLHRIGAAAVTVVALTATALAFPAPALAAAGAGEFGSSVSFNKSGATCNEVSDSDQSGSFTTNGKTVSKTSTGAGTIIDSNDAGDTTTVAASAKASIRTTESAGSFSGLSFAAAVSASVNAAQGATSECAAEADAGAGTEAVVTLVRGGWLTVDLSAPSGTSASFQLINYMGAQGVVLATADDETSATSTVWIDAGPYSLGVSGYAQAGIPGSGSPSSVSGTVKVTATVIEAGAAAAPATGKGRKYVSFAGSRNCNDDTAAVTFTGAAKKLSKATFYVNGKKKATLANPPAKVSLLLPKLTDDQAATVKAVLVPDKSGKKKPKPITVTRSYLACS